jgi:hypothetical protein
MKRFRLLERLRRWCQELAENYRDAPQVSFRLGMFAADPGEDSVHEPGARQPEPSETRAADK